MITIKHSFDCWTDMPSFLEGTGWVQTQLEAQYPEFQFKTEKVGGGLEPMIEVVGAGNLNSEIQALAHDILDTWNNRNDYDC